MTIKPSGTLKMTDIVAEFGGTPPFNLSQYYGGGPLVPAGIGVPSSGVLKFSDFYGKTKTMNNYLNATAGPYSGIVPAGAWAAKVIIRGGGGGGSTGAGTNGGGGSDPGCGGGCGYYQSFTIPVTPGQPFSGYVGAGGPGGYVNTQTRYRVVVATSVGDNDSGPTWTYIVVYTADTLAAANSWMTNYISQNPGMISDSSHRGSASLYVYGPAPTGIGGSCYVEDYPGDVLMNGGNGGGTTFIYNGTTYTANGGQGAGSVNHNPNNYGSEPGTPADGYPGAGQYSGSWPYDGKGSVQDGAGAGAGTGGQGYNEGQVSMHGGNGSTIFSSTSYPGGSHNGWASSGPGGGGDLGPGGDGSSNGDGGQGGLGGGGGGGNSDDWNTNGRGGAGGNGYVYVQWLYHNQSWYSPGTYTWTVPDGVYAISITGAGGGAGGGSVIDTFNSSDYGAGGGGSSGQLIENLFLAVSPGDVLTIWVGAGGGYGNPDGVAGASSGVTNVTKNVNLLTLAGGNGGQGSKGANNYYCAGGTAPGVTTYNGLMGPVSTYSYPGIAANHWSGSGGNGLYGSPGGVGLAPVSTHGTTRFAPSPPSNSFGAGGEGGVSTDANSGGAYYGARGVGGCIIIKF